MSTLVKDYDRFAKEAQAICKDRVYTDRLRRYAYGVDASCYSYLPKVVVKAENESEVRRLIRLCLVNVPVKTCLSFVMMASKKWKLSTMAKHCVVNVVLSVPMRMIC